ncbi:TPA: 3-oxoacyl-ACP synthase [Providencia stuartii]|nr:3-oxoacyl-ACP synthase [Providencia stuartii]
MLSVGIQALAVHLPEGLRTNSWWNEETIQNNDNNELAYRHNSRYQFYDEAMAPYLADPFLGSIERRVVVDPNESSVSLGMKAATDVLQAAAISASEIDGLIATTMFADRVGIGDAGYLANELGIRGGAFNVEATCAGSMAALLTACALVKSGQKNRVLVVATAFFSRAIDDDDIALRFYGDASAAFIVGPVEDGFGLLGSDSLHLGSTCGTWFLDTVEDKHFPLKQRIRVRADASVTHVLRKTSESHLRYTVDGALRKAELTVDDVQCVAANAPTAWHAEFSANALGIDKEKVINTFPSTAYTGPVVMPFNLYTAVVQQRIKPGEIIMLYAYGAHSEASAAVFRWPNVITGTPPAPASVINHK